MSPSRRRCRRTYGACGRRYRHSNDPTAADPLLPISCELCEVRFNVVDCGKVENPISQFPNKGVVCLTEMRGNLDDLIENGLQLAR
jgi:hypothetical protein